ncbi:MAG: hypothetical protein ACRDK2_09230 [Solirubrobacteraceae bacterium]
MPAGGEPPTVHSSQHRHLLSDFIEQAALHLQGRLATGGEIPFELASSGSRRGGVALHSYRPLTERFISEHWGVLRGLDSYAPAAELLGRTHGLERYLLSRGITRMPVTEARRSEAALRTLLEEIFFEASDFELRPERVQSALHALHGSASTQAVSLSILATLHGIALNSAELALTKGLSLVRPEELESIPEQAHGHDGQPRLVAIFTSEQEDVQAALAQGTDVLRELLRALRLFGDGRISMGQLAWSRVGSGSWSPLVLGGGGRPRGTLLITDEQQDELRAFCNLVSRRAPDGNELAWALDRFQMGCERDHEYEALSDYLQALRALLEPEGPSSGLLAGRLAALCSTPDRRVWLTERIVRTIALEREVIAGAATPNAAGEELVSALGDHLRALLRDVICAHLDPDLALLADELLAPAAQEHPEPRDELSLPQALGIDEHLPVDTSMLQGELWEEQHPEVLTSG